MLVDIRDNIKLLETGVEKHDRRLLLRATRSGLRDVRLTVLTPRTVNTIRKRINAEILTSVCKQYFREGLQWVQLAEVPTVLDTLISSVLLGQGDGR